MMDEGDDDFFYSNWEQVKSRNHSRSGQTHRILYNSHRRQINKSNKMQIGVERGNLSDPDKRKRFLEELSFVGITDERPGLTKNSSKIYSLNKRKRWLLPEMFTERARNHEPSEIFDHDIEVYFYNGLDRIDYLRGYVDSRGVDLMNRSGTRLNVRSLEVARNNEPRLRRAKRSINLREYHKKKKHAKNGNRNRNSGVKRRNETFLPFENDVNRGVGQKALLTVEFRIQKALKQNKWPGLNHNYLNVDMNRKIFTYGPRVGRMSRYYHGKGLKLLRDMLKTKSKNERRLAILKDRHDIKHSEETFFGDLDLSELQPCLSKEYELSEFLVTIYKMTKAKITKVSTCQDTFSDKTQIIYIDKEEENTENEYEIVEPQTRIIIDDLIELKVSVEPNFYRSIGTFENIVYECNPSLALVKVNSFYLVFSVNRACRDEFEFKLNSSLNAANVKEKLSARHFRRFSELTDFISAQYENFNLAGKIDDAAPATYLIGENTSRDFESIISDVKNELSLKQSQQRIKSVETQNLYCPICFDDDSSLTFITLAECGHSACRSCWRNYLQARLADFTTLHRIECLYEKCRSSLSEHLLLTLVPVERVNKYFASLTQFKMRPDYTFCPGLNCNRVIRTNVVTARSNQSSTTVRCSCGMAICRRCLTDAHYPVSCTLAKKYREEIKKKVVPLKIKDLQELYESEGKNCPNCNIYFEKNGGCTHMSCPCGTYFCWECLKDVVGHITCSRKIPLVKYESHHFLELGRKPFLMGKLGEIILKERSKQMALMKSSFKCKLRQFTKNRDCLNGHRKEISSYFVIGFEHLKEIALLNEYLALLIKCSNKNKFVNGNTSLRPNLINSLYKSLNLEKRLEEIIFEGDSLSDCHELVRVVEKIRTFVNNLTHMLRLFEIN